MAAYLDLVGQTKDVRLQALLAKTDACLQSLCQRLLPKPAAQAGRSCSGEMLLCRAEGLFWPTGCPVVHACLERSPRCRLGHAPASSGRLP